MKQWYFGCKLGREVVTSPKLVSEIASRFRAAAPFVRFLDASLGKVKR